MNETSELIGILGRQLTFSIPTEAAIKAIRAEALQEAADRVRNKYTDGLYGVSIDSICAAILNEEAKE